MTLATVPSITILCFVLGLTECARASVPPHRPGEDSKRAAAFPAAYWRALWLLCLFTSYAPWFVEYANSA
jgi:hypothetical protein